MLLFIVAYLGGVLTILSPCILPVLPFVFARVDKSFVQSGLPLLLGMALTFAAVASLAAVGGGWAVQANEYGRMVALVLMALFGLTLLLPNLADRLTRPLVALGQSLSTTSATDQTTRAKPFASSLLLGVATGLLWAPCAGPILGLVLTGAALGGASVQTSLLLLAYAAGAATSLAGALLVGGRLFKAMKRTLGAGEWIRRGLGVTLLAGVAAIALGLDTGVLAQMSLAGTSHVEQVLVDQAKLNTHVDAEPSNVIVEKKDGAMMAGSNAMMMGNNAMMAGGNAMTGAMSGGMTGGNGETAGFASSGITPSLAGAVEWLNSPSIDIATLRGKVVLIDFWTYSCINCLRALPYVQAWAERYKDKGLVVIGVHAPEFAFEKNIGNVRKATKDLKVDYPVAIDNNYAIWRAFQNQYWPAHYFIDAKGKIRYQHFGEGEYEKSEMLIQQLLAEIGSQDMPGDFVEVKAEGAQAPAAEIPARSPETYLGYERAEGFVAQGSFIKNAPHVYPPVAQLALNEWALSGNWTAGPQSVQLNSGGGRISYRFQARDLHLVLGLKAGAKPVRIRVTIDGKPPGAERGADVDLDGQGVIREHRLYQLIRQHKPEVGHRFEIEFLDPGVEAFAFTFG